MNKKQIIVLIITILLIMTGCSNNNKKFIPEKFDTLGKALDYYYELYNNEENDAEKNKLMKQLKEYVLKDINGNYYNYDSMWYAKKSYNRFIYIKSMDEVYIIPFDDKEISSDNLDLIDNLNQYKYRLKNIETKQNDGNYHKYKSVNIKFESYLWKDKINDQTYDYYKYIELEYYSDDNDYTMTGFFAEEITENDDFSKSPDYSVNSMGYYGYTKYYRSKGEVKSYEQKEQEELDKKEELKNSIPKIGMTARQVEQTKWGSPDKINKDTYSWGTKEQWVYNNYGYVYLENGVVTSISER